jgi:hypothetical protein
MVDKGEAEHSQPNNSNIFQPNDPNIFRPLKIERPSAMASRSFGYVALDDVALQTGLYYSSIKSHVIGLGLARENAEGVLVFARPKRIVRLDESAIKSSIE